jgi:curved DNA-binding protein
MEFKDYYATLGLKRDATPDEIKKAYRRLARKYHPDVSKEANAEARFKEVTEAHEALSDPERRTAYDDLAARHARGERYAPPPGFGGGFEGGGAADYSDFFESLFGRRGRAGGAGPGPGFGRPDAAGSDHQAKVLIDLEDAYRGTRQTVTLRVPVADAQGRSTLQTRQLEVNIPKGLRTGQRLRLAGQGGAGRGAGPAGDLYMEIEIRPHRQFRIEGRDVSVDLPLAPWEAALGATVTVPTPDGEVTLNIAAGSAAGRKLRLKGKGLPGDPAGDLYAVLAIVLPPADSDAAKAAYEALAAASAGFDPRRALAPQG